MDDGELLHHSKKWDRTGLLISSLCIVHCLALPVLLIVAPGVDLFLGNPYFEAALLSLAIVIGSISFWTSFQKHKKCQPMVLGLLGVIFLAVSLCGDFFSGHDHPHSYTTGFWQNLDYFMIGGGLLLVAGHFWNIHACHCFCDRGCDHEVHEH